MKSLELVLEVSCKCGKGKVLLDSTYFDNSIMTCTVCNHKETVNCYYVDELLDLHEYNSSITEDVRMLNRSGKWVKNHENQFIKKLDLDIMLNGFNVVCEVDCEETITFYRKGMEFIKVTYNPVHKWYSAYKFVANEESMNDLIQYFFKVA